MDFNVMIRYNTMRSMITKMIGSYILYFFTNFSSFYFIDAHAWELEVDRYSNNNVRKHLATSNIIGLELAAIIVSLDTTFLTVLRTEFVKGSDHLVASEVTVGAGDEESTVA